MCTTEEDVDDLELWQEEQCNKGALTLKEFMDQCIPEEQHKFSDNLFLHTEENSIDYRTTSWFSFTTLALFARRYLVQYGNTTHIFVKKDQFKP